MWNEAMKEMCADCPFGSSKAQRHMRNSLRRSRFEEICQSVWAGGYFPCHKTTKFDDDGDLVPHKGEKMCKGALEFIERIAKQREERELRANAR